MTSTLTYLAASVTDAKTLSAASSWAVRRVSAKPEPAILGAIVIEATASRLTVAGYDYTASAVATVDAAVASPGRVAVSGRLLDALMRTMPAKPCSLELRGSTLRIICDRITVELPTMEIDDFPTLPEPPATVGTVLADAFAGEVERVLVAADIKGAEAQPVLTGVLLTITDDTIALAATNRYRMAVSRVSGFGAAGPAAERRCLVPATVLEDLAKALGGLDDLTIGLDDQQISATAGGLTVVSRLLDAAQFPNIAALAVAGSPTLTVAASDLTDALKRASLLLKDREPVTLITDPASGTLLVGAPGADTVITCRFERPSDPITVRLNPTYLADGIRGCAAALIRLDLPDRPRKAVILTAGREDDPYVYGISPIR